MPGAVRRRGRQRARRREHDRDSHAAPGRSYAVEYPPLLEQCQRAFHSYLRAAINARDPRTAYYVLHQYRLLGEDLLAKGLEPAALEVAGRIRFYGRLASASELPFLLEVAAYDLAHMVEAAADKPAARDALLEVLLATDYEGAENPLGVRRAQIQLATFFLARGEEAPARRIAADLAAERREPVADRARRARARGVASVLGDHRSRHELRLSPARAAREAGELFALISQSEVVAGRDS